MILDMLADGSVNLTAVRLFAPHLTPGNHLESLESARGKKKPEVEEFAAANKVALDTRIRVPGSLMSFRDAHAMIGVVRDFHGVGEAAGEIFHQLVER